MYQFFVISCSVFICFWIETLLTDLVGAWFTPNLLIVLIVFFNLLRGIRYSLLTALLAGLLKDSFGAGTFGFHTVSFIASAYLTSLTKIYIYQTGTNAARVLLVFFIALANVTLQCIMNMMFNTIEFARVFVHIIVPEVLVTSALTPYIFKKFKRCALRLFA